MDSHCRPLQAHVYEFELKEKEKAIVANAINDIKNRTKLIALIYVMK